jgi:hypothetical protein
MVINYNVEGTYDSNSAFAPFVIKESDTSYKMWYVGYGSSPAAYRVMYATSANGTSWSNHQMIIGLSSEGTYDTVHTFAPRVIKESDTSYKMWYAGADGSSDWRTIYCTSTNGITWGNFEMVIDIYSQGTYDTVRAYMPFILEDDLNTAWYVGADGSNYFRIIRATYWQNPVFDVWDDDFVCVYHMAQDPTTLPASSNLLDSTSNAVHGAVLGTMTSDDLVESDIGKGLDFDGIDDYINLGNDPSNFDQLTVEAVIKTNQGGDLISNRQTVAGYGTWYTIGSNFYELGDNSNGDYSTGNFGNTAIDGNYHSIIYVANGTSHKFFIDDTIYYDLTKDVDISQNTQTWIGKRGTTSYNHYTNVIDEVRISSTDRSTAWVKATYHSNWDNLIVFEDEEAVTTSWLGSWANRIKLTIDHTKIDSTLVDFPVNITLASGTGINNKDVTHIFDTLTSSGTVNFEDDFSTGLGEQWYDLSGTADYSSYYLKQTTDGAQAQTVDHIQWGDIWEVIFRWKNHGGGSGNDQYHLYLNLYTGYHLRLYMRTYNSGDYWVRLIRNMGSDTTLHTNTDYNYYNERGNWFWVRMRRTLDNLKFKIWKDGDSEPSWAYDADVLDDTFATLGVIRSYAGGTSSVGVGLDDIVVTGNDSRNKKIAITTDDGTTQCPVEIERWSTTYNEAVLWTKIPVIKPNEDTILYLYYDASQPNNTTYVGDTGSSPAQNVWDDNFKAVWHMAQQPTTTLKDSISSANNGTSAGSMTSSDLVDGKIGKAIDFDGSDDNIGCGSSTLLDDISNITIEVMFEAAGWGEGSSGRIISKSDTANNYGWNVFINGAVGLKFGVIWGWDGTLGIWYTPDASISLNNWFYGVMQYGRSYGTTDKPTMYLNGVSQTVVVQQTPVGSIESDASQSVSIGSRAATDREFEGIIDEIRISDVHRSSGWIKATHYSNWNNLITYGSEQDPPTHYYDGYVKEQGSPVLRTVRLYDRTTGELVDETNSSISNGYYYLTTTVSGQHFIVAFDDDEGIEYNALILDKLLPRGIV